MRSRSQPLGCGLLRAVGTLICLFLLTSLASGHVLEFQNTTVRLKCQNRMSLATPILTLLLSLSFRSVAYGALTQLTS